MAWKRGFADNSVMRRIEVKQLGDDLTSVDKLAMVSRYLKVLTPRWVKLDGAPPARGGGKQQRPASQLPWPPGARETYFDLERVKPLARRLSAAAPTALILARLDAEFDSTALMRSIEACNQAGLQQVVGLIKWKPRGVDSAALPERLDADPGTPWNKPRAG
jgi:hypothetical protein